MSFLSVVDRIPTLRSPATAMEWLVAGVCLGLVCMSVWFIMVFAPPGPGSIMVPCVFRTLTHLHCPGCGITRCLHALAHGDIMRAWAMNPLAMLALGALIVEVSDRALGQPRAWRRMRRVMHNASVWAVVVVVFFIARNLPWAPFSWLAPG